MTQPPPYQPTPPPSPARRVARTAVQAVIAFCLSVPPAVAAASAAGLELPARWAPLVLGIPAGAVVLVSGVWNALDSRTGKG